MGMFDYYVPREEIPCPFCGDGTRREWQGKAGVRALAVYAEGHKHTMPSNIDPYVLTAHPEEILKEGVMRIVSNCVKCGAHLEALGMVKDGVWISTKFNEEECGKAHHG